MQEAAMHAPGANTNQGSVAVQPLLSTLLLVKDIAWQWMRFEVRFAETKYSIFMWLQFYESRILITEP